jgi:hypothetical protein
MRQLHKVGNNRKVNEASSSFLFEQRIGQLVPSETD